MRRRLNLTLEFDYQHPVEVRAVVAELMARAEPSDWAMLESVAVEIARQSSADRQTVRALAGQLLAEPDQV
jgi:hypothetical protein